MKQELEEENQEVGEEKFGEDAEIEIEKVEEEEEEEES